MRGGWIIPGSRAGRLLRGRKSLFRSNTTAGLRHGTVVDGMSRGDHTCLSSIPLPPGRRAGL